MAERPEHPGIVESTTEDLLGDVVNALWDVASAVDKQTKVLEEHTRLLKRIANQ